MNIYCFELEEAISSGCMLLVYRWLENVW